MAVDIDRIIFTNARANNCAERLSYVQRECTSVHTKLHEDFSYQILKCADVRAELRSARSSAELGAHAMAEVKFNNALNKLIAIEMEEQNLNERARNRFN